MDENKYMKLINILIEEVERKEAEVKSKETDAWMANYNLENVKKQLAEAEEEVKALRKGECGNE